MWKVVSLMTLLQKHSTYLKDDYVHTLTLFDFFIAVLKYAFLTSTVDIYLPSRSDGEDCRGSKQNPGSDKYSSEKCSTDSAL